METEKTITVTGRGSIHIVPDVTRVTVTISAVFNTYETAYLMASENLKDLGEIMTRCGLDKSLPKTLRFDIDKKSQNVYVRGNYTGEQKFVGYQLDQRIKIDLGTDNHQLASVIRGIGESLTNVEISIGYTVRDPRPHQLRMLERAVKDATEKARIMAEAAGCTLGPVKSIDYSEHELTIYSEARNLHEAPEAAFCDAASLDITPDDLGAGEDVTVTWYLSNNAKL